MEGLKTVQISSMIADWPRLIVHQQLHGEDFELSDDSWYRVNYFHHWNDSYNFNMDMGELFIDTRDQLLPADAAGIGEFLAAVCPAVADEGPYPIPTADGVFHEKFYACLTPAEVNRRLAGLVDADWVDFMKRAGEISGREQHLSDFLYMWAAAFGAASCKGWGLLVVVD